MDIGTVAWSVEARSPLLDHKVMEYAARLPSRYKVRGTTLKYLLKKVAVGLVPAECLERRKMGFGVPVGSWMRGELLQLLEDVLLAPDAPTRGCVQSGPVRQMLNEHVSGAQ